MSPKEKAKELLKKYFDLKWQSYSHNKSSIKSMTKYSAKQCASIAVDEILTIADVGKITIGRNGLSDFEFWNEVKTELEKL